MPKAIVTRVNPDGTYDDVGMRNRTVIEGSLRSVKIKAAMLYPNTTVRIEWFAGSILNSPKHVITYVTGKKP